MFTKLRKYWRAPTGVDAELLKTNLVVTLNRDGTVGSITVQSQTGENENNSNLKALHAERAATPYSARRLLSSRPNIMRSGSRSDLLPSTKG